MKARQLKPGDRIRLTAWTMGGWKGRATVIEQKGPVVQFRKDGSDPESWLADHCFAMRYEVRRVRS